MRIARIKGAAAYEAAVFDGSADVIIEHLEYPGAKGLNPLSLWNLHWVKELDDGGFIDSLVDRLST